MENKEIETNGAVEEEKAKLDTDGKGPECSKREELFNIETVKAYAMKNPLPIGEIRT